MLDITQPFAFLACSVHAGTIREWSEVWNRNVLITKTGDWVPMEDALRYLDKKYPVWCPAEKKIVQKNAIFATTPSHRQGLARPDLGGN